MVRMIHINTNYFYHTYSNPQIMPTMMVVAMFMKAPTTKEEALKKKALIMNLENGAKVVPKVK